MGGRHSSFHQFEFGSLTDPYPVTYNFGYGSDFAGHYGFGSDFQVISDPDPDLDLTKVSDLGRSGSATLVKSVNCVTASAANRI